MHWEGRRGSAVKVMYVDNREVLSGYVWLRVLAGFFYRHGNDTLK